MYKFLIGIFFALSVNAEIVGGLAVLVEDKAITLYEINKEMRNGGISERVARDFLIRQKLEETEIEARGITVTSGEVYDDIKQTAKRANVSVNGFYEAMLNKQGLDSNEVKKKIRQKLLSQKLYSAIAYSKMSQPSDAEIEEYYELNKASFEQPVSFDVVIYGARESSLLQEKIANPMSYSPNINMTPQVLPADRIAPELAQLLTNTPERRFTQVLPDGRGGFMTLYLKGKEKAQDVDLEGLKPQIQNMILNEKREAVLGDYFARLQQNAQIKILRELN